MQKWHLAGKYGAPSHLSIAYIHPRSKYLSLAKIQRCGQLDMINPYTHTSVLVLVILEIAPHKHSLIQPDRVPKM